MRGRFVWVCGVNDETGGAGAGALGVSVQVDCVMSTTRGIRCLPWSLWFLSIWARTVEVGVFRLGRFVPLWPVFVV